MTVSELQHVSMVVVLMGMSPTLVTVTLAGPELHALKVNKTEKGKNMNKYRFMLIKGIAITCIYQLLL